MGDFDSLRITAYDHIEFAVDELDQAAELYLRFGFEKVGTRVIAERKLKSYLMAQNDIFVLLSHSDDPKDKISQFVTKHGDGICTVAFKCDDCVSTLEKTVSRNAEVVTSPKQYRKEFGEVQYASIRAFGDVEHCFVSRNGGLFLDGFESPVQGQNTGYGLLTIDHVTNNVEAGQMDKVADYYERVFGFKNTRFFDIHTERTGLYSKVMQSPNGLIKMPINEPTESQSQIQEFLDINHGPGVQHLALTTKDIVRTLRLLVKEKVSFLEVPRSYYETVAHRVPNVTENMKELEELGILVDGSSKGYLLQIFTQNLVGPFFYEVIQRKGDDGFGEGNFKALFEAIERDQIRRGTLKA